jgi:ABC-type branched-subunit amino acid transport system ATPase component/predicted MFS family arabinose efflux permease
VTDLATPPTAPPTSSPLPPDPGSRPSGRKTIKDRLQVLRPSRATAGEATFPLLVLFGLNAVDELDQSAFSVLLPNIRDAFGLDLQGVTTLISLTGIAVLLLEIPLAQLADRKSRVRIAAGGAAVWGLFTLFTGLAPAVLLLGLARVGAGLGRTVNGATHRALLSDYYSVKARPTVFGFHSAANSVGQFFAPLLAGFLGHWFGWRLPFLLFAVPTLILVALATRLKEPVRGAQERKLMSDSDETIETEEAPASFAEAMRILWQVRSLRRIWMATPILAFAVIARVPLLNIFYADVLGLNTAERGVVQTIAEPFQFVGLFLGIPLAAKLLRRDPKLLSRFIGVLLGLSGVTTAVLVLSKVLWIAVVMNCLVSMAAASILPALYTVFSLAIPPRVRSVGFSIGSVFALPAFIGIPIVGGLGDQYGITTAILLTLPVQAMGVVMLASAGNFLGSDINKLRTSTVAMAEVRAARKRGEAKLLVVRELDAGYDSVQVLFGVDFEVDEGEIVALLGTNGAGKSTLLKAISGVVESTAGAVIFDGVDMTYAPPNEVVSRGVVQVPGGKGVFPELTVAENLKIAGWLYRKEEAYINEAIENVLTYFPVLRERWDQPGGNLSGGEQQMLTLGMAFIAKPRLLMIDELSLGLAPIIVEQLLKIVEAIRERGTTIILVEQSVNIALTIAQTAYFMEKGEIRFNGPTDELLQRPEILRSVFLEGAGTAAGESNGSNGSAEAKPVVVRGRRSRSIDRTTPAPSVLDLHGVTKAYGGVRAVNDVSLELREGEILGIIGPNGAGKTTLFDLISGFVIPDSGSVLFDDYDVTNMAPDARARLGMGRSFQDARLFPALTVTKTIALALERKVQVRDPLAAALKLPVVAESEARIAERVDELIQLMRLEAFADKFVAELSTGSRRIVDLACILAHEPKVILFDEPSSGIAQRETEALGPLLVRIREATGASLLVIEHDMPLITGVADRMLALDLGAVVTTGRPDEVVNHPAVVAAYLGTTDAVINRSGTSTSSNGNGAATRRRRRRSAANGSHADAGGTQ